MKKLGLLTILALMLSTSLQINAQTICAVVKIEIRQELSFERQAFDAKMVITNGLDIVSLENLDIDVWFEDIDGNPVLASSDPDNTNAKFFIRIDSIDGVNDVNGSGVINAGDRAEIHWLIIPAPGTGGLTPIGIRYGVGATVSYTYGEESQTVNVVPDFITVTPTPLLKLDYFLPTDVFGDNPLTNEVEAIEPFDLGLRISNIGAGIADDLKIESAQPRIIENNQGLLINFELLSTSVNDESVTNSLLADIGQLNAGKSAMVSWLMQSSLNGEFVSFEADFVHSDELGGQLTSLIDAPIDTHILFQRVKVDYSGRDQIRDFLAYDEDVLRVYESNGGQATVIDESSNTVVTDLGVVDDRQKYQLNFNAIAGAGFVRWLDPYSGVPQEITAFRSDGKLLPSSNIWQYRIETDPGVFEYYFGLFDVESTGQYTVIIIGTAPNVAPVITVTSPQNGEVGALLSFDIEVTDANVADSLTLVSVGAPSGSSVSFVLGSTWRFSWLPQQNENGTYDFVLNASDQTTQTTKNIQLIITVAGFVDSDNDGMADDWEQTHFGNLNQTAEGDFDNDSATNGQEYEFGGNPTQADRPEMPQILNPVNQSSANRSAYQSANQGSANDFTVINSDAAGNASLVYEFELYVDQLSDSPIASASVTETNVQTTWVHGLNLIENSDYLWRVRAFDGITPSLWNYDRFKYSTINDVPLNCALDFPISSQVIDTLQPTLTLFSGSDSDSGLLKYRYKIYSDAGLSNEIGDSGWMDKVQLRSDYGMTVKWQPYTEFQDGVSYYWSAQVKDEVSIINCGNANFSIDLTASNAQGYTIDSPDYGAVTTTQVNLTVNHDSNVMHSVNYSYTFEMDSTPAFSSPQLIQTTAVLVDVNNQAGWSISGLLSDTRYFWRVKATNGIENGPWKYAQFKTDYALSHELITAVNPSDKSWVSSKTPELKFHLDQHINNLDYFTINLYSDEFGSNLIVSETLTSNKWVAPELTDRNHYYWKVQAVLTDNTVINYIPLQQFFIIDDLVDEVSFFEFESLKLNEENSNNLYTIHWSDADDDSNASIEIFYDVNETGANGVSLAANISEDDETDSIVWDLSTLNNKDYYLYATITDNQSAAKASTTIYSNNALSIKHHAIDVQSSGIVTSETGDSVTITLAINKLPKDFVSISVNVPDTSEAILDKEKIIFTPNNWMFTQQVTVTGIDDAIIDGNQNYQLVFSAIQSKDSSYANLTLNALEMINIEGGASGTIGDLLWSDVNANSLQDNNEPGIASATLYLCTENTNPCDSISAIDTSVTDATGHYVFTNVELTVEHIVAVDTTSLSNTFTQSYDPEGIGSLDNQAAVAALNTSNNINLNLDFGYNITNSITGTVWSDADGNGLLTDGSAMSTDETNNGVEGVSMELMGNNLTLTTLTDSKGNYSFLDLDDGSYTIRVTDEASKLVNMTHTIGPDANDNSVNNNSQDETGYLVTITGGVNNDSADFGYKPALTTPITLASFKAVYHASTGQTIINWSTLTETGNIGFQLYSIKEGVWHLINDTIIPSKHVYRTGLTHYRYVYKGDPIKQWGIADIDIKGARKKHGIYQSNKQYGEISQADNSIKWLNIQQKYLNKNKSDSRKKAKDINHYIDTFKNKAATKQGGKS